MSSISALLNNLLEREELQWLFYGILVFIALYFVYNSWQRSQSSRREQLNDRFDSLLKAQTEFADEWQRRYRDTDTRLETERTRGDDLVQRIEALTLENANLRSEVDALKRDVKMFLDCPKDDCPFRNLRRSI